MISDSRKGVLQWCGIVVAGSLILIYFAGVWFLPRTYRFGTEVTVSRTPDQAWAWFVRPNHWTKRFPMFQSIDGSITGVGTRRRVLVHLPGGKKLESEILITDFTKGQLYADQHNGDWLDGRPLPITNATDRLEFYPEGQGRTRITFTGVFEVNGLLNRWIAYFTLKPMADRVIAEVRNEYDRSIQKVGLGPKT